MRMENRDRADMGPTRRQSACLKTNEATYRHRRIAEFRHFHANPTPGEAGE